MKKLLLVLITLLVFSSMKPDTQSDYCDGWEDGYCEGWKDVKGQLAICPIAPMCPIPEVDCRTYRCGYNKGFKAGRADAED